MGNDDDYQPSFLLAVLLMLFGVMASLPRFAFHGLCWLYDWVFPSNDR